MGVRYKIINYKKGEDTKYEDVNENTVVLCRTYVSGVRRSFSVNSNLGVSPVNSLPYVISLILKVDLGRCIIGVFITYMIVQIIIKRRRV